jgi:Mg-chelatase subunit ChlD
MHRTKSILFVLGLIAISALAAKSYAQSTQRAIKTPQGPGQSMLVLDASGSMWGQIGGRAKIEIARDAVTQMLETWPNAQRLGLMAYGHRSKGECSDIEVLRAPATLDKAVFKRVVDALQPKGMTPISASVRMAAEQLKFSEQKATVILVSDGEETCNADPCAVGKELEKLGVDFTAHVIGFDIAKGSKAEQQLQCLASSTGGRYLDARDAGSLSNALRTVASAPPSPPPAKVAATEGREWMPNTQLWWEAGTQLEGKPQPGESELGSRPFAKGQTARQCQAQCKANAACGAWVYEPANTYFIDHPRCNLIGTRGALREEKMDPAEGWVAGVKPGAKLMYQPATAN